MSPLTSNDATDASPATALFPFKDLPLELRRLIWFQSLPGPRVVHLHHDIMVGGGCSRVRSDVNIYEPKSEEQFFDDPYFHNSRNSITGNQRQQGLRAYEPIPAALLVCRESHDVASRIYTKAFRFRNSMPSVWFSFERDTLFLMQHTMESLDREFVTESLLREDLCKVQRLAMGLEAREKDGFPVVHPIEATSFLELYDGLSPAFFVDFFSGLKSLKELTIAQNYHYQTAYCFGLKMIDRINYPRALELFTKPFSRQADKEFFRDAVGFQEFVDEEVGVDMKLWVDLRSVAKDRFDSRQGLLDYPIPKIVHKTVLPPQELLAYHELKAAYDQKKSSHMELLRIQTSIYYNRIHEMSYLANRSTTVNDLCKALQSYWPLKPESRLVVLIYDPLNQRSLEFLMADPEAQRLVPLNGRNHNLIMADPEALVFGLLDERPAAQFRIHYSDDKECTALTIRNRAQGPTGINA